MCENVGAEVETCCSSEYCEVGFVIRVIADCEVHWVIRTVNQVQEGWHVESWNDLHPRLKLEEHVEVVCGADFVN